MEDDLEAQLVQQLAEVRRLRAEREAQEREHRENEYRARYQEEQWRKHEGVAQRVAEAKQIQHQVQIPEASGSGRNGDAEVSSPSPSPVYIRLIRRQAAWVSGLETEIEFLLMESKTGKSQGHPERCLWRLCRPRGVLRL